MSKTINQESENASVAPQSGVAEKGSNRKIFAAVPNAKTFISDNIQGQYTAFLSYECSGKDRGLFRQMKK